METFTFREAVFEEIRLPCNTEAMTTLVEALESGRYPQANGRLRRESGYCCLGVGCEKLGSGQWTDPYADDEDTGDGSDLYDYNTGIYCAAYYLPKPVAVTLGVPLICVSADSGYDIQLSGRLLSRLTSIPYVPHKHDGTYILTAAVMNDQKASFADIAARLRKVYL